ncbi:hypothetical protein FSP39_000311 [Pinctada imbricata]|uniref:Fucosyltransferase n=1 Tax=Pinctada imbricata TaxID=66713 RepID=A0AA88XUS2_PINIB|nr:hypothetical protein FSP39_000311 [Pinctada imbricata]
MLLVALFENLDTDFVRIPAPQPLSLPASAPVKPASPHVKPASAPVKPASPHVKPASAPAKPASPHVKPASLPVKPASPHVKPASLPAKPASPHVKPASLPVKPASPFLKPASPHVKPASLPAKPASPHVKPASPPVKPASPFLKPNPVKILYWNPPNWVGTEKSLNAKECLKNRCQVTYNRMELDDAIAVIFEVQRAVQLPKKRMGQVWIFSTMESIRYNYNDMKNYDRKFNWTWTYRRDSDILKMYDTIQKRKTPDFTLKPKEILKHKSKDIFWMVGHCSTSSKREEYVKKLKKYMKVDIIGSCGVKRCAMSNEECFLHYEKDYRYYLSFENSLCRDYATEKLFGPFIANIVPITRGGYNASLFVPPNSYINANDFSSPYQLYQHLINVSSNADFYEHFFAWKQFYNPVHPNHWCDLCSRVINKSKYHRVYENIRRWWKGGSDTSNILGF